MRVIDETEAPVVVRIFEFYASGLGLKAIAKRLTREGVSHPKPFRRKDGLAPIVGWSPATIRTWWVRRFRFGPAECLWRSLTYLRLQPLR